MIGHVESEPDARTFSDYLYVQGIKNQVEAESDGRWAIWIHVEDEIERAHALLRSFLANPNDDEVRGASAKVRERLEQEEENERIARKRHFDRDRLFPARGLLAASPLAMALIAISVLVYIVREFTNAAGLTDYLFISDPNVMGRDLEEVRNGQVWRLLTPIFLHFNLLHILFNMLWMRDLGATIESRLGSLQLFLMVLVIGISSNLAQFFVSGPKFGGMSGVVYGLLGFIWMKGRFDPGSGLFLHSSTVTMMLIWLAFGYTNILPMANTVHTVGLVVGAVWGFTSVRTQR